MMCIMFFVIFGVQIKQKNHQYNIERAKYIFICLYLCMFIYTEVTCQSKIFEGHFDGKLEMAISPKMLILFAISCVVGYFLCDFRNYNIRISIFNQILKV